jgi:hypothetical protein
MTEKNKKGAAILKSAAPWGVGENPHISLTCYSVVLIFLQPLAAAAVYRAFVPDEGMVSFDRPFGLDHLRAALRARFIIDSFHMLYD